MSPLAGLQKKVHYHQTNINSLLFSPFMLLTCILGTLKAAFGLLSTVSSKTISTKFTKILSTKMQGKEGTEI